MQPSIPSCASRCVDDDDDDVLVMHASLFVEIGRMYRGWCVGGERERVGVGVMSVGALF